MMFELFDFLDQKEEKATYTICTFQFQQKEEKTNEINIAIYPSKKKITTVLCKKNNYTIGGEIFNLKVSKKYTINRLIKGDKPNTNILVKCIDDNSEKKICLKIVKDNDIYYDETPNKSSRTYATLVINPVIDIEKQKYIVEYFNKLLEKYRDRYHSLFLTNYRESKDIARKRISFSLVYQIVGHLLLED